MDNRATELSPIRQQRHCTLTNFSPFRPRLDTFFFSHCDVHQIGYCL
ncbi:Protein of unknown function [Pyronema omphalodes CBS 100304]|uniref:Uncharacterized protein n=1 Tax=Pyronema omphalodes (strain CBS 100304) TaxID=1076935 RepID=U4L5I0_PYROM|nr:Protein of unknown function [Pyronema omphalodes CBS 100304]